MRRALPFLTSMTVLLAYAGWIVFRPESAPAQAGWGVVENPLDERLRAFLFGDKFWMAASYALSAGFTVFALSIFHENRRKAAVGVAGGVAFAGAIYGLGCFMLGCCGSPMLAVYVGLLGARGAKLSGPLMFGVTLLSIALGVWMLKRRKRCCPSDPANTTKSGCC